MKTTDEKLKVITPYILDILSSKKYLKLKTIDHHWEYSIFDHCVNVAYHSFKIARFFNWDYLSTVRAGMLHDFFLYNWKKQTPKEGLHGFVHPKIAYNNSIELFKINEKEKDIILKHMFPITVIPPKYKESYLLCMVDKCCATSEIIHAAYMSLIEKRIRSPKNFLASQFINSFVYLFLIISMTI